VGVSVSAGAGVGVGPTGSASLQMVSDIDRGLGVAGSVAVGGAVFGLSAGGGVALTAYGDINQFAGNSFVVGINTQLFGLDFSFSDSAGVVGFSAVTLVIGPSIGADLHAYASWTWVGGEGVAGPSFFPPGLFPSLPAGTSCSGAATGP
jgi:hypothetical protein